MERIQRALEQMKQSQTRQEGVEAVSIQYPSDIIPDPLVYRQTKTMPVSVPSLAARRVLVGTDGGPFLEAYKILRTQILHRLKDREWNVVGVTSPGRQEGKTLVATNLAISIAMENNHTAMLIDGNLREPQVHQLFDIPNIGLANYLLDDASIPELLIHPEIDRLVVMPAGGPVKEISRNSHIG